MKYAAPVLLVLLGTASCSPVEKVVKLLEDLQSQIEADGKAESLTYNKFACWCEKTATRKAGLITVTSDGLRSLGQQILKLKAEAATLTSEITELKTKIKTNEDNQESLTAIRTKENTKYTSDSTESKETLAALAQAIKILVQATKPGAEKADALLQEDSRMQAQNAVRTALAALPTSATISPAHVTLLGEFTKLKHGGKYAPQSATIQGILSDMYSTISTDLESTTMEEATKNTNYEKVIASMQQEVIDMSASLEDKEKKKAAASRFWPTRRRATMTQRSSIRPIPCSSMPPRSLARRKLQSGTPAASFEPRSWKALRKHWRFSLLMRHASYSQNLSLRATGQAQTTPNPSCKLR
jgi:hypothetical protein